MLSRPSTSLGTEVRISRKRALVPRPLAISCQPGKGFVQVDEILLGNLADQAACACLCVVFAHQSADSAAFCRCQLLCTTRSSIELPSLPASAQTCQSCTQKAPGSARQRASLKILPIKFLIPNSDPHNPLVIPVYPSGLCIQIVRNSQETQRAGNLYLTFELGLAADAAVPHARPADVLKLLKT